jgi:hypothetical protein
MLAELAVCNAAFAVIKETVQNGGDIMAAGQKLFDFFDNKNAIQKKANSGNDMEAFAALEQIKTNEAELKRMMVYHGRAGLWDDWLKFQKEAKQRREAEEKAEFRKKAARKAKVIAVFMWGLVGSLLSVLIVLGLWVVDQLKGRGS